jgi:hypothetical protein
MGLRVLKNNRQLETFDVDKLSGAIFRAMKSAREPDYPMARKVAQAVERYLVREEDVEVIASKHLRRFAKVALVKCGFDSSAAIMEMYERRRKEQRRKVRVVDISSGSPGMTSQWNKSRLARWLEKKHHLSHGVSRAVSAYIEEMIFRTKLKVVTSDLIRQLAVNELLTSGLMEVPNVDEANVTTRKKSKKRGKQKRQKTLTVGKEGK